jgi:hypothetical protein
VIVESFHRFLIHTMLAYLPKLVAITLSKSYSPAFLARFSYAELRRTPSTRSSQNNPSTHLGE